VVTISVLFLIVVQGACQVNGSFNASATAELLDKAANGLPQTPDEKYLGKESKVHEQLKAARLKAKLARSLATLESANLIVEFSNKKS
jgi:hypothetical protein